MKYYLTLVLLLLATIGAAQVFNRPFFQQPQWDRPAPTRSDRFVFCRLYYVSNRIEPGGSGWLTDYPWADRNLTVRLSELTPLQIEESSRPEMPNTYVVEADSPSVFRCPLLYAVDVGTLVFRADDVTMLRRYLEQGGFLWVDDFWGEASWNQWLFAMNQILPGVVPKLLPPDHSIFNLYAPVVVPQIPNIDFWRANAGATREQGEDSPEVGVWGAELDGRLSILMTHNTDVADTWEREADDPEFFYLFAAKGYAFAANVVLYAMTH